MRVGFVTAKFAALVDKFNLDPTQYAALTDRQLHEVYFHPRTKEGAIELPAAIASPVEDVPQTKDDVLAGLERLKLLLGGMLTEEDYQRAVAEAEAKYGEVPG